MRGSPDEGNGAADAAGRALPEDVGRHNRALVLAHLFEGRSMSRSDLAAATSLTKPAVTRIVEQMLASGLVRERARTEGRAARGRPHIGVELDPGGAYALGAGIGAYDQSIRLVDLRGECLGREQMSLLELASSGDAVAAIAASARALVRKSGIPAARVAGMVLAVAGVVDHVRGVVVDSPNIGWHRVEIGRELARRVRVPVRVDGLHHILNLAQARAHAGRGEARSAVLVNVALGIGASAMERGRIVRGGHAMAGQIGHLRVPGASELCTCGRRGCLDTVASGYAVLRALGYLGPRRAPREHRPSEAALLLDAIERERGGDARALTAFRRAGEHLGVALRAVRSVLDPDRIWLAGPLSQAPSFVDGVRARVLAGTGARAVDAPMPVVVASHAGDEAAALVALRHFAFGPALDLAGLTA